MKPLKLTISAFASYAGTHPVIDFTALDAAHKPFVISGKTGCGKTTIFDAITYALYGQTSGHQKEVSTLRCKTADPAVPTYVEMEFEARGEQYRIRRSPAYIRPSRRGGEKKENAAVMLTLPSGRTLEKEREVSERIAEIIGLNVDQFRQVVLIAQGDFRSLLTASTRDRQDLFRKLFHTEKYAALQEKIADRAREAVRIYDRAQDVMKQQLSLLTVPEEMQPQLLPLREEGIIVRNTDAILTLVHAGVEADVRAEQGLSNQLAALRKQQEGLTEQHQQAVTLAKNMKALQEATLSLHKAQTDAEAASAALQSAMGRKPEMEDLQAKALGIAARYGDYTRLEDMLTGVDRELAQAEQLARAAEAARQTADRQQTEIDEKRRLLTLLPEKTEAAALAKKTAAEADERIGQLRELAKLLEKHRQAVQDQAAKQQAAMLAVYEEKKRKAAYSVLDQQFYAAQAGILAERLAEGSPCPVCGSVHHPAPAALDACAPRQDDVDKAMGAWQTAQKEAAEAGNDLSSAKSLTEALSEQLQSQCGRLLGTYEESGLPERLRSEETAAVREKTEAEKTVSALEKELAALKQLQEDLPLLEQHQKEHAANAQQKQEEAARRSAAGQEQQKQAEALREQLPYGTRREAEQAAAGLDQQRKLLADAISRAETEQKTAEGQIRELQGRVTALKEQIDAADPALPSKEAIEALQAAQTQIIQETETQREAVLSRRTANERQLTAARRQQQDVAAAMEKRQLWEPLHRVAGGKLDLETYVQMQYLDRVLLLANRQFQTLSDGRYIFIRREISEDARKSFGLDLDVRDCRNGSERAVSSLSGGESFMAALSLALGMSETITAGSAVRLDTLFIDEGFGTLDDEALSTAVRLLMSLSGGSRMVGVISHVDELKRRLGNCIEVTKDENDCSHARVRLE